MISIFIIDWFILFVKSQVKKRNEIEAIQDWTSRGSKQHSERIKKSSSSVKNNFPGISIKIIA